MDITEKIKQYIGEGADTNNSYMPGELGPGPGEETMWKEFKRYWKRKFGSEIPSPTELKNFTAPMASEWKKFKDAW